MAGYPIQTENKTQEQTSTNVEPNTDTKPKTEETYEEIKLKMKLKKEAKKEAKKQHRIQQKKERGETESHPWPKEGRHILGSALFERYYGNILGEEEMKTLVEKMRKPLPVTFRFSESNQMSEAAYKELVEVILPKCQDLEWEGEKLDPPKPLSWYPGQKAFHFDVPKIAVRREPNLKQLHTFLKQEFDVGTISRQEAVSMLPVLWLNAKPEHKVIDMCAAPGMKTLQLIDLISCQLEDDNNDTTSNKIKQEPTGYIVSNDLDGRRTHLLAHNALKLRAPAMMVTHQDAANYPKLKCFEGNFDRVLCDVPCSGDGTLRKAPYAWVRWSPNFAFKLHPLQFKIALRGSRLLKVGGRMVYSTCSLNPTENEAVVTALLKATKGALQLVDARHELPSVKCRPGLKKWETMTKERSNYFSFANSTPELYDQSGRSHKMAKSCWAPTEDDEFHKEHDLSMCKRIYPQDDNTGGFFVCVLEKVGEIPEEADEYLQFVGGKPRKNSKSCELVTNDKIDENNDEEEKEEEDNAALSDAVEHEELPDNATEEPYYQAKTAPGGKELLDEIVEFYGLKNLNIDNIFCRKDTMRNLTYVPSAIRDVLIESRELSEKTGQDILRVVNTGVYAFKDNRYLKDATYRVVQDGLEYISPYMQKRTIPITQKQLSKFLEAERCTLELSECSKELQEIAENENDGTAVVTCKVNKISNRDLKFVVEIGRNRVAMFVGKEEICMYRKHLLPVIKGKEKKLCVSSFGDVKDLFKKLKSGE